MHLNLCDVHFVRIFFYFLKRVMASNLGFTEPEFMQLPNAGSSQVRNRKQEIISQDDLDTLAVESIKRTTTDTHLELCVCV